MMNEQYLTPAQLAKSLQLSKRTISRLSQQGAMPAPLRIGGSLRWSEAKLKQWTAAGCPRVNKPMLQRKGDR